MVKRSTGIVRKIDKLGRAVIPKETLMRMNIANGDRMEFFVDDDGSIVLKKYLNKCVFCGEEENLNQFKDKLVCEKCRNTVKNARPVYY